MRIAILGFGVEGVSAYHYFLRHEPGAKIEVFDQKERPDAITPVRQVEDFSEVEFYNYDLVIRTPSIPPWKINGWMPGQTQKTDVLSSVTEEFFKRCPAKIIGVTGTKGKGTTCSLIKAILEAAGKKVFLVGNIGTPALDVLDEIAASDIVVYEMSSFQLWNMRLSPQIAVVTTIAADHLDVHKDFAEYLGAKSNITRHQTADDLTVYYAKNEFSTRVANYSLGQKLPFPSETGAHIADEKFYFGGQEICPTSVLQLLGEHNIENALGAISAVWEMLFAWSGGDVAKITTPITRGLSEFRGLPHRIELVRELDGVKYYDDSFSAAVPALEVAVKAMKAPVILIAGGFDRGLDNSLVSDIIKGSKNIKKTILIGQTAPKIAAGLAESDYELATTLAEAVEKARDLAEAGDVVLLSPGAPSFDMFENFKDRGERFQKIVKALGETGPAAENEDAKQGSLTKQKAPGDTEALDEALFLSFVLAGTSYYKTFPTRHVKFASDVALSAAQVAFFDKVYQEGLGQFAYENGLRRADLAHFGKKAEDGEKVFVFKNYDFDALTGEATFEYGFEENGTESWDFTEKVKLVLPNEALGDNRVLSLQSGGKDSLLLATLLAENGVDFVPWFLAAGEHHPKVLDDLGAKLLVAERTIDREQLRKAAEDGAKNGHIPITYVVESLALVQAILLGIKTVVAAIGQEGVEPHAILSGGEEPDLAVNHQWSKTWEAEKMLAEYVSENIAQDLLVGSPLRELSELKIAEMFAKNCWVKFGRRFSSCNVANYRQHADNSELKWCGNCPKCANAWLLFAPFVAHQDLTALFDGQDLFKKDSLEHSFKGLLGIEGVIKPFECVGSVDELRQAYDLTLKNGYEALPFAVPTTEFDYDERFEAQAELKKLVKLDSKKEE